MSMMKGTQVTNNAVATAPGSAYRDPSQNLLDAEAIYDLGYARGVREALATLRLTAGLEQAEPAAR
jgi:hypothetical protein